MVDPKTQRDIRRHLLRPLVRRSKKVVSAEGYSAALGQIESRATGEQLLDELRPSLKRDQGDEGQKSWTDVARVRKHIALVRVLYQSRRISKQQYVFQSSSFVEDVHEHRIIAGGYKDVLKPIEDAIDRIERKHRLKKGHYWPRGRGPKEHVELNRRYEEVTEAKFIEALLEFGLNDVADLRLNNRAKFDQMRERGRRSVFHSDEYVEALKDVVRQYEIEAEKAASVEAYSVAITALGAGLEGLVLLRCLRSPQKALKVAQLLPRRTRPHRDSNLQKWNFEVLIDVCLRAGWLPSVETPTLSFSTAGLAHLLRAMRNYVHPGRTARERPWLLPDDREYRDAAAIYTILLPV